MYLPKDFELTDRAAIAGLISAHPLAVLVAHSDTGLCAHHIPLIMTADRLIGHIAAGNDLHRDLDDGHDIIAIFQGADAYISPNWYPSKAETHEVVPTWNYTVAHVHGVINFHHDQKTKLAAVGQLTQMMEQRTNADTAWRMGDAPRAFLAEKLDGIVAFDIKITRILGKAKLSQNKPEADRLGAAAGLEAQGTPAVAKAMRDPDLLR